MLQVCKCQYRSAELPRCRFSTDSVGSTVKIGSVYHTESVELFCVNEPRPVDAGLVRMRCGIAAASYKIIIVKETRNK